MTKVLLTGFEPFGKASQNPSAEIVKAINGDNLVTAILPVAYAKSANVLRALIVQHKPDVVICLGQAEGRKEITPERVAINLDDARFADNEGVFRTDSQIVNDGPDAYFSTLPVKEIVLAINEAGIPATVSLSAGTFLCNHIFYLTQHHLAGTNVRSGFVHVPLMDEQAAEFPGLPTMPLAQMLKAVRAMLDVVAKIMDSILTCPNCAVKVELKMPTDACQFFYTCRECQVTIKPLSGECCVFCSYGSVPCPSQQI